MNEFENQSASEDVKNNAKVLEFVIFCIEMYAQEHEISGRMVMDKFYDFGVLDFLRNGYDVLHTQGKAYILSEIDVYLRNRGLVV